MFVLYYIILYYITVMAAGKCVCLGDTHTHTHAYTGEPMSAQIVIWTDDDVNT